MAHPLDVAKVKLVLGGTDAAGEQAAKLADAFRTLEELVNATDKLLKALVPTLTDGSISTLKEWATAIVTAGSGKYDIKIGNISGARGLAIGDNARVTIVDND